MQIKEAPAPTRTKFSLEASSSLYIYMYCTLRFVISCNFHFLVIIMLPVLSYYLDPVLNNIQPCYVKYLREGLHPDFFFFWYIANIGMVTIYIHQPK